jgi:hypothetical protein
LPASHTVGIPVWCSLINRCVSQARCLMKGQGLWKEADMEEEEDVSRWAVGRGGDGEAEGSPVLHYSVPPEVERGTQRMLPQLYIHLWETIADGWGGGEGGGGGVGGGSERKRTGGGKCCSDLLSFCGSLSGPCGCRLKWRRRCIHFLIDCVHVLIE